jgi:catechol 2,3-dioxygenase-like lactoylglutathione lyase family enzyme
VERLTLHHLALRVSDCERAAAFYEGVLGLRELRRFHEGETVRSIWLRAGDAVLMLERALRGHGPESGSGHLLALSIDSLAAWETRLRDSGVPIDDRSQYTLYVRDPDGHRVGLTVYENPD